MASPRITVGSTFDAKGIEQAQRSLKKFADESKSGMDKFTDSMQKVGRTMTDIGGKLTKSVTLPLVGVGIASFKTAMDFESSMTKIQSLVGFSAEAVADMGAEVRRLAGQTAKAPKELADALFFATSAGLNAADAIDAVEQAARASAVGLGDVQTIVDLTTSAMNAYGSDTLDAAAATDALTMAVRLGKLEPSQLAGAMGAVLPVASAMGVSFDEVGAAFAAMSRTGTGASEAATQLRGILSGILKPSKEAQDALADIGLTTEDLHRSLREDGLLATLELLVDRFDGNVTATSAVFGNVRALSGVMDMLGGNVDATREVFEGMSKAVGVTDEAFAIASETAEFKFNQAMTDIKVTMLDIGSVLLPIVSDMLQALGNFARKFTELSDGTQRFLVYFGGFVALIGPVVLVVGKIATGIAAMARAFVILRTAMMAHPILAAATVITLIATALLGFNNKAKEAKARTDEFADSINRVGRDQTLRNSLIDLIQNNEDFAFVLANSSLSINELETAIKNGTAGTKDFQLRMEDAAEQAGIFDSRRIRPLTDSVKDLNGTFADAVEKNTNVSLALVGTMEHLDGLNQAFIDADEKAGITGHAFDDLTVEAKNMGVAVSDAMERVANASEATMQKVQESMTKGAETFTKVTDDMLVSGEEFIHGLINQRVALEVWGANLGIIAANASAEFVAHLAEMGTSGAAVVADLARDLDLLAEAEEEWQRRNAAAFSAAQISVSAAAASMAEDIRRMNEMLQFSFSITPPGVGGDPRLGPGLMPFYSGGLVPGPVNAPMPILAHGGEYVLSADVVDAIRRGGPSRDLDPGAAMTVNQGPAVIIENYTAVERSDDEMLIGMLEFAVRGGRL